MLKFIGIGAYSLRFLCCVVALGLSATLVNSYQIGSPPTTLKYGVFTGGFGMITCFIAIVALFVEAIPMILVAGLEAISGLLLLGAGIAFAIGLRGTSCSPGDQQTVENTFNNNLINEGSTTVNGETVYGIYFPDADSDTIANRLVGNCKRATVDEAFQFVAFGFALLTLFLCFLYQRNGRPSTRKSYL